MSFTHDRLRTYEISRILVSSQVSILIPANLQHHANTRGIAGDPIDQQERRHHHADHLHIYPLRPCNIPAFIEDLQSYYALHPNRVRVDRMANLTELKFCQSPRTKRNSER
jgi:hypothetical protein